MSWLARYRLREFLRSSFWAAPACAAVCAILMARFLRGVDSHFHWRCFDFTPDGARLVLGSFISSMLTFVVVVVSSLLLIVQIASAQLTPRIIAPTFRHPLIRFALSIFVFAYTMSIAAAGRIEAQVPQLTVAVVIICNTFSLVFFLFFVGAVGMWLRPTQILSTAAAKGRKVIFDIYPAPHDPSAPDADGCPVAAKLGPASLVIEHKRTSGVLLAFDGAGLVNLAQAHKAVIELVPLVGTFVATGEPLFRIYSSSTIDPSRLRTMVALGAERTIEQDPAFAIQIVVDIACKALSPAINDPTTAVLAIDQLHRLLRWVGTRRLLSGIQTDSSGATRLIFPTPSWNDFVWLATSQIRHYGASSVQTSLRLRSMLEHLLAVLPESRRPPLRVQLRLLDAAVDRAFADQEDRDRVRSGASGQVEQ